VDAVGQAFQPDKSFQVRLESLTYVFQVRLESLTYLSAEEIEP